MTRRTLALGAAAIAALLLSLAAIVAWLNRDDAIEPASSAPAADASKAAALVARGAYLVRAGSCLGCHTDTGGAPYAGGRAIETPFGAVYAPNLTPDPATGLGAWSADDFWRALHNGRSRDGRLLYPAFPYPNYTRLARADADAMFAFLQSLAPVAQANKAHALDFPFDRQASLAVWRALYFRPARFASDARRTPAWNRGAYLVETLGHCNACHSRRNVLGATAGPLDLAGGLIPIQNWYAPSLEDNGEAGVGDWPVADVVALLQTGVSPRGSAQGPMAEVVARSTQYLHADDLAAMAEYLISLPHEARPGRSDETSPAGARLVATPPADDPGARLYTTHCSACHGDDGRGVAGAYPALAGNRAVALTPPANLVHIVLRGGFAPATAGHPRPFGMPPFAMVLGDAEIAALLSYVRRSWGQRAPAVSALDVGRYRGAVR